MSIPPSAPPPLASPRTGMAAASMILGLASFLFVGPLLSIPAIITGLIARSRAGKNPAHYGGRGMALAGILAGILNLILFSLMVILVIYLFKLRASQRIALDMRSMRQVSIGLAEYSSEYEGYYPPHLAGTLPYVDPRAFVAAGSSTVPPTRNSIPDLSSASTARMDASTDWFFVGGLLRASTVSSDSRFPLLYSRAVYHDQRLVAFADAHIEMLTTAQLEPLLANVNKVRSAEGFPPATLDEPPPMSVHLP